jgi:hypothetical protein
LALVFVPVNKCRDESRHGRHSCPIPLKFSIRGVVSVRSAVYLFAGEPVSDIGVEVGAFGFGGQKLGVALLGNLKILVEQAGVELDFEQLELVPVEY